MSENAEAELIAEQLKHTIDLLRADIVALRAELKHEQELSARRLQALEEGARDHEARLRAVGDAVTGFKVWSGLASGGSWLVSLAALLRTWFGP